jgi:pimeloyl-ACP methyl ester carboxylesterase
MELFYRVYGAGRPLIILHGLFGLSDNWVTFARMMTDNFKIYIPDLRNHGQSPQSSVMNYSAMAEDIFEFIQQHEITNPIILGHSMGGKVAMQFGIDYPELPNSLIIVDISTRKYIIRDTHLDVANAMMSIDFDTVESRKEIEDQIAVMISDPRIQLFILKNLYRPNPGRFAWRPNLASISENLDILTDRIPAGNKFTKPVLFTKGGKSDYILDSDLKEIGELFDDFELSTIKDAGHWVHADTPITLHEIVDEFLKRKVLRDLN